MRKKRATPTLAVVPDEAQVVSVRESRIALINQLHPDLNPSTNRPYGILPQQRIVLIDAIRAGNFFTAACQLAGINYSTFQNWMLLGGDSLSDSKDKSLDPQEPYKSFAEEVREAEAESETNLLASIRAAGTHDWRAPAWILARTHPDRWGEQKGNTQIATTGDVRIILPDNNRESEVVSDLDP